MQISCENYAFAKHAIDLILKKTVSERPTSKSLGRCNSISDNSAGTL